MTAKERAREALVIALDEAQGEVEAVRAALMALDGTEPLLSVQVTTETMEEAAERIGAQLGAMKTAAASNGVKLNGNGKSYLGDMSGRAAILTIAAEHRGQGLTAETLWVEASSRGLKSTSANPTSVIAAALTQLANKGELVRPEPGVYVLP